MTDGVSFAPQRRSPRARAHCTGRCSRPAQSHTADRPETALGTIDTPVPESPPRRATEKSTAGTGETIFVIETKRLHPLGGLVAPRPPVSFSPPTASARSTVLATSRPTTGRLRELRSLRRGVTLGRPRPRRGSPWSRSFPVKVDLDHVGGDSMRQELEDELRRLTIAMSDESVRAMRTLLSVTSDFAAQAQIRQELDAHIRKLTSVRPASDVPAPRPDASMTLIRKSSATGDSVGLDDIFKTLCPLEYLAVADEVAWSAVLRWILGPDSPLPVSSRARILSSWTGESYEGALATTASTEWSSVDLVVAIHLPDRVFQIAFENKVKAVESPNQLARYDTRLTSTAKKLFLTPTGRRARSSPEWSPLSYAEVRRALSAEVHHAVNRVYLDDYLVMIDRLLEAVRRIVEEPEVHAAYVFSERTSPRPSEGFCRYVETLKMEKLLQGIWLSEIAAQAQMRLGAALDDRFTVEVEPEKQALLNVESSVYSAGAVGLQLQHGKFKFFTRPHQYLKVTPTEGERALLLRVLHAMNEDLTPCESAPTSAGRGKGFRSFVSREVLTTRAIEPAATALRTHIERLLRAVDRLERKRILVRSTLHAANSRV